MNSLKNSVRLMGFLGGDPEIMEFGDQQKRAKVSLATHSRYKNTDGDWVSDTQWHTLIFWRRQAEFAEKFLRKGSEISIEGKLVSRSYVDKDDLTRYVTEVTVNEVIVLNRKTPDEEELAGRESVSGSPDEVSL